MLFNWLDETGYRDFVIFGHWNFQAEGNERVTCMMTATFFILFSLPTSMQCGPCKGNCLMYTSCKNTWWESSTSIFLKTNSSLLFYNIFTNSDRLVILLRPIFHLHFHHIHCYCSCYCCLFQYVTIIFSFPFLYLLVQNTVFLVCLHVHPH